MGCVEWLKDAGLINVCECLQFPELPLKGNVDESKYKVYISDTGLLVASLDDESQIDLRANKNLGIYKGALYENFAAEALVKQGYGLYYYSKDNSTPDEAGYRRDYKIGKKFIARVRIRINLQRIARTGFICRIWRFFSEVFYN